MSDWRSALLAEVTRAEEEALAEVDAVVREQGRLVRERVDTERHRLRQALAERARQVSDAGTVAAARALVIGGRVAGRALTAGDAPRAMVAHAAAQRAHDQLCEAADALAEDVRAAEGELSGPLVRASRAALSEALPSVRRIVAEAARRTADELRDALELCAAPPSDNVATWRRSLGDTVRQARETVAEQGTAAVRSVALEVDRAIDAVMRTTAPLPDAMLLAVESGLPRAVEDAASAAGAPRVGALRRATRLAGASVVVTVVVGLGVVAMAVGVAVAVVALGTMALWGSFAPPATGGLLAGFVAVLLGALGTDLLFDALGDWGEAIEDGLTGAIDPAPRPRSAPEVDLREVLAALRLPPIVLGPVGAQPVGSSDLGRFAGGWHTSTLHGDDGDRTEG